VCRIGPFTIFQPTFINDDAGIITAIFTSPVSFKGIIGFVPEVLEMFCFFGDLLLEYAWFYVLKLRTHENNAKTGITTINKRS